MIFAGPFSIASSMRMSLHAHLLAIGEIVEIVHRAAQADLHGALGIEHALLDGAPERRAMRIFEAAEIAVIEVGMGIEMDHADRPLLADRAQDRAASRDDRRPPTAA